MAGVDQDQSAVAAEEPWLAVVRSRRRRQQGVDWSEGYARLAACHLVAVCGETLVAVALAGTPKREVVGYPEGQVLIG